MSSKSSFEDGSRGIMEIMNNMNIEEMSSNDHGDEMKKLKEFFKKCSFSMSDDSLHSNGVKDEEHVTSITEIPETNSQRTLNIEYKINEVDESRVSSPRIDSYEKEADSLKSKYRNVDRYVGICDVNGDHSQSELRERTKFLEIDNSYTSRYVDECRDMGTFIASRTEGGISKYDSLKPMSRRDLHIIREPTISEEENTVAMETDHHAFLRRDDIGNGCVTSQPCAEGRHSRVLLDFIEAERPGMVEYRNGRIILPNTPEEDKLMVITKKDLKDFLQDNCIDTQTLVKEIRASNDSLKMHFQESVGKAFHDINMLLREMKEQKNENRHDEHLNAYINYSYEKIMKDNEEMKNVMRDLMTFTNDGGDTRKIGEPCRARNFVEEAEIDCEGFGGHGSFTSVTDCVDEGHLELEVSSETITQNNSLNGEVEDDEREELNEESEGESYHAQSDDIGDRLHHLVINESTENEFSTMGVEDIKTINHKESFEPPEQ